MSTVTGDPPHQIGRYPILGELGRGGMGIVYLAEDPTLERHIAIKVLPEGLANDPERGARFEREAKLLASLNHPNIAVIHSLEESEGRRFLTLEFIEGETLTDRLASGRLSVDDTVTISRQIASALDAAHQKGVVHRDLKPDNIKITPDGLAKVLDFGIAKVVQGDPSRRLADDVTASGAIVGTPGYMSPEQILGDAVDGRADLWALGCIVYECLAGRRAVSGKTPYERLSATLMLEPDWRALPEETPDWLRELLSCCLTREVDQRVAAALEVRQALEERIAQRAISTVLASRPRPPSASTVRNNLPLQLTRFIGRERELDDLRRAVAENRLVTLTGAGGCGKSRLALEVAARSLDNFDDGTWLIQLASLSDSSLVPATLAAVLGLQEERGRPVTETIAGYLKPKKALILLDNCEHQIDPCARLVERVLEGCPDVAVLATSRESLGIPAEARYRVPSLARPEGERALTVHELAEVESVCLFVDRAQHARADFKLRETNAAQVAKICRRLDGIPLAIELAAARVATMPVAEIADRLDASLQLLTGGSRTALPRLKTLRGCIDWSHEQLAAAERTLHRRLAVFAGGFTLAAAEKVCAGGSIEGWEVLDLLTRLVEKSLVEMDAEAGSRSGVARYRLLEPLRQYAWERLVEAGEEREFGGRHRDYFVEIAEKGGCALSGPEQATWLARLDEEHDNLRAAVRRSATRAASQADAADEAHAAQRIAAALIPFWNTRGHWKEGRRVCEELLALPGGEAAARTRVRLQNGAAVLAMHHGDYDRAQSLAEESLLIARERGDRAGVIVSLNHLGSLARRQGAYGQSRSHYEESLAISRELGDLALVAAVLDGLGKLANDQRDYERAGALFEECLAIARELGDAKGMADSLGMLGSVARRQRNFELARTHYEESLAISRELDLKFNISVTLSNLGSLAYYQGDFERSDAFHEEGLAITRQLGDREGLAISLFNLAGVAIQLADFDRAVPKLEESLAIFRELGHGPGISNALGNLGAIASLQGELERASMLHEESLGIARKLGDKRRTAMLLHDLGELAMRQNDPMRAQGFYEESLRTSWELGGGYTVPLALVGLGVVACRSDDLPRAARLFAMAEALEESQAAMQDDEDECDGKERWRGEIDRVRDMLGEPPVAQEWAAGQSASFEEAIQYVLGPSPPPAL